MGLVTLTVGGRRYDLACRDGEEQRLRMLAGMVDAKAVDAARALGEASEPRQLLFAALLLADELSETREGAKGGGDDGATAAVEALAERIEALANRLENGPARA